MAGALPSPALCLISDETRSLVENERNIRAALDGGCRWVQLRHRRVTTLELHRWAQRIRSFTIEYDAALIINDRIDVAASVDADGVHLPAAGLSSAAARRVLGADKLIGRSVHSIEEILELKDGDTDYFQFGPVFDTESKRAYGAPQGLDKLLYAVTAAAPLPVCAVGGITLDTAAEVRGTGAGGIAVIGAIHCAADPQAQTLLFLVNL